MQADDPIGLLQPLLLELGTLTKVSKTEEFLCKTQVLIDQFAKQICLWPSRSKKCYSNQQLLLLAAVPAGWETELQPDSYSLSHQVCILPALSVLNHVAFPVAKVCCVQPLETPGFCVRPTVLASQAGKGVTL